MLKGTEIILYKQNITGTDLFGAPIIEETEEVINNVLIAPVNSDDLVNELSITGKKVEYKLAIPKEDENSWTNCRVKFYGQIWKVVGTPAEGLGNLMPLAWNKIVKVERYE